MSQTSASTRQFEISLVIAAPRDAVWDALATESGLRRWFAPEAGVQPRKGGELFWRWGEHFLWRQEIEAWQPGSHLRTRYASSVPDGAGGHEPLFIDFRLEGDGGTTTLRLVQSGFGHDAAFDEEYDGISRGWPVELRSLRLFLERHRGRERHLAWSTEKVALDADEAWRRLTGEQGLACGAGIDQVAAGEPFRFQTPDGDVFEGEALYCAERELAGVARSHGDGFLRLSVERVRGASFPWVWLATYGEPGAGGPARGLKARWDAMLGRLFAGHEVREVRGERA